MSQPAASRLVGVYRAEGSLRGELAYLAGKLVGRAHCSLCDITHSPVRRKAAWDRMVERVGVPFELVHLDERTPDVAALVTGWDDSPAVLVERAGALSRLLGPDDLEPLHGDVEAFERALRAALAAPAADHEARGSAAQGEAERAS
ncbi:MAG: hypothetical protein LCI03_11655 [Actinobacteria bacterium]|jgi:hypothetical protein|nr:hypothetical protein [Actinomycetota bacterium]